MEHDHTHGHPAFAAGEPDEVKAMLAYMAHHNEHHTDDLRELAESLPERAAAAVLEAAAYMDNANEKLNAALRLLGE